MDFPKADGKSLADFPGKSFQSSQLEIIFHVTILSNLCWPWRNRATFQCLVNPVNANLDSVVSINTLIRQYLVLIYRISTYQGNIPERKQALPVYVLHELGGETHLTSTNKDSAVSDTELIVNLHSPGRQKKNILLTQIFLHQTSFLN